MFEGGARCDIRKRDWSPPPHPASCSEEVDFGQGLAVSHDGKASFVCAGDTTLDPSANGARLWRSLRTRRHDLHEPQRRDHLRQPRRPRLLHLDPELQEVLARERGDQGAAAVEARVLFRVVAGERGTDEVRGRRERREQRGELLPVEAVRLEVVGGGEDGLGRGRRRRGGARKGRRRGAPPAPRAAASTPCARSSSAPYRRGGRSRSSGWRIPSAIDSARSRKPTIAVRSGSVVRPPATSTQASGPRPSATEIGMSAASPVVEVAPS